MDETVTVMIEGDDFRYVNDNEGWCDMEENEVFDAVLHIEEVMGLE
jgi:hypothetical protein